MLEIEVQGARQVAETMPDAVRIFIAPPSEETLRLRLVGRGHETPEQIDARMNVAKSELAAQEEFGHVLVAQRLRHPGLRRRGARADRLERFALTLRRAAMRKI